MNQEDQDYQEHILEEFNREEYPSSVVLCINLADQTYNCNRIFFSKSDQMLFFSGASFVKLDDHIKYELTSDIASKDFEILTRRLEYKLVEKDDGILLDLN